MSLHKLLNYCCLNILVLTLAQQNKSSKPNIIIILADDLGINDVSFRGSDQIPTPNIDSLAYHGVILNRYYVPALCTPSRTALFTGKYPIRSGMQHYVIPSDEPWGLPLNVKIMPEIFREAGYSTNLVGKWHLGFLKKKYTPLHRGFDYHFGYYGGYIDYYDHSLIMLNRNYSRGYDMRKNLDVNYATNGTYATDLFNNEAERIIKEHDQSKPLLLFVHHLAPHTGNENNPLQAPKEEIEKHRHISNPKRRIFGAMISKLDDGVGMIIEALSEKDMLKNSIVIFYSDNGAPTIGTHANSGSNHPLRGKDSPWEGGIRTPSFIWSKLIKIRERIFYQTMHSVDWLPTLAAAAGIKLNPKLNLDGQNLWKALQFGSITKQRELLHNIDEIVGYSSYMQGSWKYINGTTCEGACNQWLGKIDNESGEYMNSSNYPEKILQSRVTKILRKSFPLAYTLNARRIIQLRNKATIKCSNRSAAEKANPRYLCDPNQSPCLFNIESDPCEEFNLAWKYPIFVRMLGSRVEMFRKSAMPSVRTAPDPQCDPVLHNYTWTWWKEYENYNIVEKCI